MHDNKTIAIDVDGTLFIRGQVNEKLRTWCIEQKEAGYTLMLWSARGQDYAKQAAIDADMVDIFADIVSKPAYIVDDMGWTWIKYTKIITKLVGICR